MEEEINAGLPNNLECPTISKDGDQWTFVSATHVLVSSQKSDKEFMLRLIQQWKDKKVR